MRKAGLLWTAGLGSLLVCAGANGCGETKSAIMLAVTTDMKAPKDVNAVSVTVSTNNTVKHNVIGRVTPEGDVLLPATLAIVEPDDPNASVRIRVMAFQERRARVLRDVRTSIPSGGRVALLRIPLNFVNDGSTVGELPDNVLPAPNPGTGGSSSGGSSSSSGGTGDGGAGAIDGGSSGGSASGSSGSSAGSAGDLFDPFVFVPNCPNPEHTWIDGECVDAYVDPNSLPDYDESLVGRGDQEGVCFDVARCFAEASPLPEVSEGADGESAASSSDAGTTAPPSDSDPEREPPPKDARQREDADAHGVKERNVGVRSVQLDRNSCSVRLNGESASNLNLAIVTPDTGECIRPGACYIPLDSGPGGWREEGGQVKLPSFVCKLISSQSLQLHYSTRCSSKTEANPICMESAPSGGPIAATLVIAEDYASAVNYYDSSRIIVAAQNRISLVDIVSSRGAATALGGFALGDRLPWTIERLGDEASALAFTNGTTVGYKFVPQGDVFAGSPVQLPGPGINVTDVGSADEEGGGSLLWAVGGSESGFARSDSGATTATRLEGAWSEEISAMSGASLGTLVVGDKSGGVRLCNATGGCRPRNQLLPGRVDSIKVSWSDGFALGGDGVYRSTIVDVESGEIQATPLAVPARVSGLLVDGHYFRHDLLPIGDRCVLFTSEDGVEVVAGNARRVVVPIDSASGRRALGIFFGGSSAEQFDIYFTVFASRDNGGGVYTMPLPQECSGADGEDADPDDDSPGDGNHEADEGL